MNITDTPLSEQDIATLVSLGVNDFHNDKQTGEIYIKKRFWNGCTESKRNELTRLLVPDNAPQEQTDKGIVYSCTDVGNSERFIAQHGKKVQHISEEKHGWIIWDRSRWKPAGSKINKLAKQTAKSIYGEAERCKTSAGELELSKWAKQSQFGGRLTEMLKWSKDGLAASITEFDSDPYSINCKNGYLNLKTLELAAHTPDMRLMKLANANYDPVAECPTWTNFVESVFQNDKEMIDWTQRVLGYCLTGSTAEQQFYIMHGTGENGKGVLNETVMNILGDYACPTQSDIFITADTSNARALENIGRLKGIRFASASEVGSSKRWSEETIKRLTGSDTITGAAMYGARYDYVPSFKLVFQVNHLPSFKDPTHGFKRRVRVIPFRATFRGEDRDKHLSEKLLKERDGIFRWLVEGAQKYFELGLDDIPSVVREATDQYVQDNDTFSPFIDEVLEFGAGLKCYVGEAYGKYVDWCVRNGLEAQSKDIFVKRMEERDIYRGKRDMKGYPFVGIGIRKPTNLLLEAIELPAFTVEEYAPIESEEFRGKYCLTKDRIRELLAQ